MLTLAACSSPESTPVSTQPPPAATATRAPSATPQPTALPTLTVAPIPTVVPSAVPSPIALAVDYENIHLLVPDGLGVNGAEGRTLMSAAGAVAPLPFYKIALQNYSPVTPDTDASLFIYAVADYVKAFPDFEAKFQALQTLLATQPAAPDAILDASRSGAKQVSRAQVSYVDFQNGRGVRFIPFYAQMPAPFSNELITYTYVGVTNDGQFYVVAHLSVRIPFLPLNFKSDLPQGGVPFPTLTSTSFDDPQYVDYLRAINTKLNTEAVKELEPDLNTLDTLSKSLRIDPGTIQSVSPEAGDFLCLRSGLMNTAKAFASLNPPRMPRLRQGPNLNAEVIEQLAPGDLVQLSSDNPAPVCSDNHLWWQVIVEKSQQAGWIAEGTEVDPERFLLPCPAAGVCPAP